MSKKDNVAAVPKYRFPEFALDAPIDYVAGEFIFDPITNRNHHADLSILAITQEYGAIPRDEIDYKVSVTKKSLKAYKIVEKGNFIISLRSFQGGIEYSMYDGICSPAYIILRKKTNIIDQYYKYYFKSHRFIQDLNKDLEGIRDGKMISYSQFSSILLPKPDEEEQQKIADCLSSIDDLISAEEKKLSLLNDYKKGWMQKLFPAEGKTVPEWRFPEFQDSEEWAQKKLDEIGKFIRGFSYSSQDTTDDKTKLLVIRSNNIVPMGKTDYINNLRYVNKKCSKEQNLVFGDITICMANGSSNLIGKSSFYDGGYAGDITVGAFCGIFRSSLPIVRYLFQTNQYNRELQRVSQGGDGAIANLKEIDIKNIEFLLPTLTEEQQKIAGFLSGIDDLITRQTDRIEAFKQHKKALMQGLFPSIEEVCK